MLINVEFDGLHRREDFQSPNQLHEGGAEQSVQHKGTMRLYFEMKLVSYSSVKGFAIHVRLQYCCRQSPYS